MSLDFPPLTGTGFTVLGEVEVPGNEGANGAQSTRTLQVISDAEGRIGFRTLDGQVFFPPPELDDAANPTGADYAHAGGTLEGLRDGASGDIMAMLSLFHQIAVQMRKQAREGRLAMRDQQMSELQDAADKIRSAAAKQMWSGIAMGAATMAGGALSMGGGLKGAKSMKGTLGQTKQANAQAQIKNAQANVNKNLDKVNTAQQRVNTAQTKVNTKQVELDNANANLTRVKAQNGRTPPQASKADVEAAELHVQQKRADLDSAKADLKVEQANLKQAQTDLKQSQVDFDKAVQKSGLSNKDVQETLDADETTIRMREQRASEAANTASQDSMNVNAKYNGLGQVIQGMGQGGSAVGNNAAEADRAEQKEAEANATKAESLYQDENDMMRNLNELLTDIHDKLKTLVNAQHESRQSIMKV